MKLVLEKSDLFFSSLIQYLFIFFESCWSSLLNGRYTKGHDDIDPVKDVTFTYKGYL